MAKKSFFERLTGATKEEIIKSEPEDEVISSKETNLEEPKKASSEPKSTAKKMPKEKTVVETTENKEEWPPEEEGQLTIDVYQTENDIVIKSTIAGVKSEDLDVTITNDMITIKGMRRQDESIPQEEYYYQELYWGPFSRSVILPVDVDTDKAKASIKDGILTIRLPKVEKEKTKTIKVRTME